MKGTAHHRWIRTENLYDLRADDRAGSVDVGSDELGTRGPVLYGIAPGPGDRPEVWRVTGEPLVVS